MTNLDSILKSRDITLPTKVDIVKAMIFPVVMHRCEDWTEEFLLLNCGSGEHFEGPVDQGDHCKVIKPVNPKGSQP